MEGKLTIEFAHICETVILAKNGNLSIINIFNQINAPAFPAVHSRLTIVIGAVGSEGEYEVNIKIKKQDGEQFLVDQLLPNKIQIPKYPAQGRLFINLSLLKIESAGKYEITISIAEQTKTLLFEARKV